MRQVVGGALVLLLAVVVAACAPDGSEEEQTFEDYCDAVHEVYDVQAEATSDGVLVTWDGARTLDEPATFVVHRRPTGATPWQRVEEVDRLDDDYTYLDTRPAEQAGVAYEYEVTYVLPACGGESELCPPFACDPPPAATPRQE
ncbi:hypothetical protein Cfla_1268 [Cellulomonas flavigena DSM 20109]|uniref:Fibronectin type III domain protein n=1 Tax=Cellulomonas flavigena (strain ATCC 482 / DSM 20109 / BCRC 11376 / JCM 18109 / NBRC 3775 / NCIMB 8073 / NRS 134) TaxID=446466 RepID=D5UBS3_CELFN|nr:fibronectin type III domain-containing protein [Cellulomonas flavigena]ADG74168.1 hypothetical protein Cfla_1268 [Cellulomonas flavigena DSM 20109]